MSDKKMQVHRILVITYMTVQSTTTLQTQPSTVYGALLTQQCQMEHIISHGKSPADHE